MGGIGGASDVKLINDLSLSSTKKAANNAQEKRNAYIFMADAEMFRECIEKKVLGDTRTNNRYYTNIATDDTAYLLNTTENMLFGPLIITDVGPYLNEDVSWADKFPFQATVERVALNHNNKLDTWKHNVKSIITTLRKIPDLKDWKDEVAPIEKRTEKINEIVAGSLYRCAPMKWRNII